MDAQLKIFVVAATSDDGYGIDCGMVIAESIDEAYELFRKSSECYLITKDDIEEIPMSKGYTYIGGYAE